MTTAYIYDPIFLKHTYPGHPEGAKRLEAITTMLATADFKADLHPLSSRAATDEELGYAHPTTYITHIKDFCQQGGGHLNPDTYTTPDSYQAACFATGSLIDLTLAVIKGAYNNGFALVRPPGHHATQTKAMGFCLFANVAIAAKAALKQGGLARVAVIDFDVHHGNGTQAILDDNPQAFFSSSHQYPYYPGTGRLNETGQGKAKGTKVNFPLMVGVGDEGFKKIYDQALIPLLHRFQPQLILVSAGYDAHWDDPLANLGLTLNGLAWISKTLVEVAQELCDGKIVFTLEGGYNLNVLSHGVANSFKALLGRNNFQDPLGQSPWPETSLNDYLSEVKRIHKLR